MTLANRTMTTAADVIQNISVGRFDNLTQQWGASTDNFVGAPDWGRMIWEIVNVYPDFVGPIGWFILFLLPFAMMWIAHADMVPVGILGIFFGLYVFAYVGGQYEYVAQMFMVIALATIVWSLWQKRG